VPDELTGAPAERGGAPAAAPPADAPPAIGSEAAGARPARRPSWPRAALLSLVVLTAGAAMGAAGYHVERTYSVRPPQATRTAGGWRIEAARSGSISGLALDGPRLLFLDGPSIEYVDLRSGKVRLLGPGPGMRATWQPAVGERYALWFEAERTASVAARAIAYDTVSGRRWAVADVGIPYSYAALSGDTAVWCSAAKIGSPGIRGVRIASATGLDVAAGSGTPDVAADLVVWANGPSGPFTARELSGGDAWPVVPQGQGGKLTGFALAGRVIAWGQAASGGAGTVSLTNVDGGRTTPIATGVPALVGPSFDGKTIVWAERGKLSGTGATPDPDAETRLMARPAAGGPAVVVATTNVAVTEVAVSGRVAAWIASDAGFYWIETARLPR
jgi:hypothetical protein